MSTWEPITLEHEQWSALVKQLEDLLSVQCLLDSKPSLSGMLTKPPWDPEPLVLSLKQVLDGGRGELQKYILIAQLLLSIAVRSYLELLNK